MKPGTVYPAVLFMTADTRHARRPHARQEDDGGAAGRATVEPNPILLRIETKAGHGAGKPINKLVDDWTDIYSFLFWQLGKQLVSSY